MAKIEKVRAVIIKHCDKCCIGVCQVCILNTIKKILNYEGCNYVRTTKKSNSHTKSRR